MTVKSRGIGWWYPAAENRPDWFRFTEDCSAMAPVFDMWNHHAKDNCAWIAPGYPRALEVIAMEDVKVDQELFIGYGNGPINYFDNCSFDNSINSTVYYNSYGSHTQQKPFK